MTYKISWRWLAQDSSPTVGACLLSPIPLEPLREAAVTEGVSTFDGIRFEQRTYADSTYDQSPNIIKALFDSMQQPAIFALAPRL